MLGRGLKADLALLREFRLMVELGDLRDLLQPNDSMIHSANTRLQ